MKKPFVIRCLSCGSSLIKDNKDGTGLCKHCGSLIIMPKQDEEIIALLNSALVYRENYNYDLAIKTYQLVLEKDPTELSAYEGILLSEYGIEYVKDSYTGKLVPTCHRAHFKSIFEDENYKNFIALASETQKISFENKAKEIDILQKSIEKQLENEEAYDIFISYKATDESGEKTEDSLLARQIYDELSSKNYKVFLAEKSLENRLGTEYEPIIFKAIHTAKLFILVGTDKNNIESVWVRNEWSRFIDRIKNNELKTQSFVPVFKNMSPYDMPKINNSYVQGVDASKLGWLTTLSDGVEKIVKVSNSSGLELSKAGTWTEQKQLRFARLQKNPSFKRWHRFLSYILPNIIPLIFGLPALFMNYTNHDKFVDIIHFCLRFGIFLWLSTTIASTIVNFVYFKKHLFSIKLIVPLLFLLIVILTNSWYVMGF